VGDQRQLLQASLLMSKTPTVFLAELANFQLRSSALAAALA